LSDLSSRFVNFRVVRFGGLESVREGEFDKGNLRRGIWEGEFAKGNLGEGKYIGMDYNGC
jgi:hypothetical protein